MPGSKNDLVSPSAYSARRAATGREKENGKHRGRHVKSNTCRTRYLSGIRLTSRSLTETHILHGYMCMPIINKRGGMET